jgi:hypothetical protein
VPVEVEKVIEKIVEVEKPLEIYGEAEKSSLPLPKRESQIETQKKRTPGITPQT